MIKFVEYDWFVVVGIVCGVGQVWVKVFDVLFVEECVVLKVCIKVLFVCEKVVLVVYYYVDVELQELVDEMGGCVVDLFEMVCFGCDYDVQMLVVVGVCFMGEIVKILSLSKWILMFDFDVICLFDFGCLVDEFLVFCDVYFDCIVVVYVNISVVVKVCVDWMVMLLIGFEIVVDLYVCGEKIIWVLDCYFGSYIQKKIGVDMLLWQGLCFVYDEFKGIEFDLLCVEYLDVKVFVYFELLENVVVQVDVVGLIM